MAASHSVFRAEEYPVQSIRLGFWNGLFSTFHYSMWTVSMPFQFLRDWACLDDALMLYTASVALF